MRYEFDEIVFKSGRKNLIIVMEDEYRLVGQFLMSDIQGTNPEDILKLIDKVENSESSYEEVNGNVCGVELYKDKVIIFDNLSCEDNIKKCEISIEEFRNIIEIWYKKNKEYRN